MSNAKSRQRHAAQAESDPRAVAAAKSRERQREADYAEFRGWERHLRGDVRRLDKLLASEKARADYWKAKARGLKAEVRRLEKALGQEVMRGIAGHLAEESTLQEYAGFRGGADECSALRAAYPAGAAGNAGTDNGNATMKEFYTGGDGYHDIAPGSK